MQGSTVALISHFILKQHLLLVFMTKYFFFILMFQPFYFGPLCCWIRVGISAHVKGEGEEIECGVKRTKPTPLNFKGFGI